MRSFLAAIAAGDVEAATECLAPDSSLVTPDATTVSGRGPIRGILAQLIAQRPQIAAEAAGALVAGDVAYVNQRWRVAHGAAGGEQYVQVLSPILVLRRLEGEWKVAIAAPWRHA